MLATRRLPPNVTARLEREFAATLNEADELLAPNGMRPTLRLPYPMQLGSGTFDALAGLTYA